MQRRIVIVRDGRDKVQIKVVVRTTRSWVYVTQIPNDPDEVVGRRGGTGFKRERLFQYNPDAHVRLMVHEAAGRDPWILERNTLVPFDENGSTKSSASGRDGDDAIET